eukprot:4336065-Pyramimonas_sp.AAC.2
MLLRFCVFVLHVLRRHRGYLLRQDQDRLVIIVIFACKWPYGSALRVRWSCGRNRAADLQVTADSSRVLRQSSLRVSSRSSVCLRQGRSNW